MATGLYDVLVPVLERGLTNLSGYLRKGAEWARDNDVPETEMMQLRLIDDMAPLTRQVQIASDSARGALARIATIERPPIADDEATFADLQARIDATLAFIRSVPRDQIDGREEIEVTLPLPSGEMKFTALAFVQNFVLPNVYFHLVTAYALLRQRGVPLGKMTYLTGN